MKDCSDLMMLSPVILNKEDIWRNFDLSIVMPFYKKMVEFRRVLPRNHSYLERNGIEVIIVLDCPDEKEDLIEFIKSYPFINWRVVVNENTHEWRNPAKPLNVGLRFSTKKYVMVCSPESEMLTDIPLILRKTFEDYPDYPHFAIGRVCFVDEEVVTIDSFNSYQNIPFGSIMVEKKYIEEIRGYDETFSTWGGDDNNIRSRLEMIGVSEFYVNHAMMVHRDIDNAAGKKRRSIPFDKTPNDALRHFFFPKSAVVNDECWGTDFNKIIYDWRRKLDSYIELKSYLDKNNLRYQFMSTQILNEYPILLMVQTFNEANVIMDYLEDSSKYVDGIILLDDESTDNTFDVAHHDKLLIKVQKKRKGFNDLENRNLLLNIVSFFNYELGLFLDADERIDDRFSNLANYVSDDAYAYLIPFIHLWDSDDKYNSEYPNSFNGICLRYKMFRNIGHCKIYSNIGKLHFHQVPTLKYSRLASEVLIKHYGLLTKDSRANKYMFYKLEDTEGCQDNYEHFSPSSNPKLDDVDNIGSQTLINLINKIRYAKYINNCYKR